MSPGPDAPTQGDVPSPSKKSLKAVLNWADATIELPLDRYGMSPRDEQLVVVAQSIVYARCVQPGDDNIPTMALQEARRYLAMAPDANHWLFGYWNAPYLARNGPSASAVHSPRAIEADQATAARCAGEPEHRELEPIGPSYQPDDEQLQGVMLWSGEAFDATLADRRFVAMTRQMGKCLRKSGLAVDRESGLGGAELGSDWSADRRKQALMVEASCRDSHGITQRTANIAAEIQRKYVVANLPALAHIRSVAAQRVAKAKAILREAGLP